LRGLKVTKIFVLGLTPIPEEKVWKHMGEFIATIGPIRDIKIS